LNDIVFNDIIINSRSLLYFEYNDVSINNIEAENIKCVGDGENVSFINFNSGEANKIMKINNINIKNSFSNGPFIKITGNSNDVEIINSSIYNISSFGPIIMCNSKKVIYNLIALLYSIFIYVQ